MAIGESGQFGFVPLTEPQRFEEYECVSAVYKGAMIELASGLARLRADGAPNQIVGVALNSALAGELVTVCTDENTLYRVKSDIVNVPVAVGSFYDTNDNDVLNAAGNASNATLLLSTVNPTVTGSKFCQVVGASTDPGAAVGDVICRMAVLRTSS